MAEDKKKQKKTGDEYLIHAEMALVNAGIDPEYAKNFVENVKDNEKYDLRRDTLWSPIKKGKYSEAGKRFGEYYENDVKKKMDWKKLDDPKYYEAIGRALGDITEYRKEYVENYRKYKKKYS